MGFIGQVLIKFGWKLGLMGAECIEIFFQPAIETAGMPSLRSSFVNLITGNGEPLPVTVVTVTVTGYRLPANRQTLTVDR